MEKNEVKILNQTQVKCYLKDGYSPKRIELGYNNKIVFVYDSAETQNVFTKWVKHEFEK